MTPNYYQIGRKLTIKHPEFARHLQEDSNEINNPEIFIPELYARYLELRSDKENKKNTYRLEFIAIVVKHLDPQALDGEKSLKFGVRAILAKHFNCSLSAISHTLKTVKNYMVIYKDFKTGVEYLYSQLFNEDAGTQGE